MYCSHLWASDVFLFLSVPFNFFLSVFYGFQSTGLSQFGPCFKKSFLFSIWPQPLLTCEISRKDPVWVSITKCDRQTMLWNGWKWNVYTLPRWLLTSHLSEWLSVNTQESTRVAQGVEGNNPCTPVMGYKLVSPQWKPLWRGLNELKTQIP